MPNRKVITLLFALILGGCTSTPYPPALQQIIAQSEQVTQVDSAQRGVSVDQLLNSVRRQGESAAKPSKNNTDWMYVTEQSKHKQLSWQYEKGNVLPDQALLNAVEQLIEDPNWQLQTVSIGKPIAEGQLKAMVLAQKRAVRLKLFIPHQIDVKYEPQLGLDQLKLQFSAR